MASGHHQALGFLFQVVLLYFVVERDAIDAECLSSMRNIPSVFAEHLIDMLSFEFVQTFCFWCRSGFA
jgi:hypothetical protein